MPHAGEEFCGFRLVEELGHGTFAHVYLAKQQALADRLVAVKVSMRPTREPERLARLQHTNVVPVYSVHTAAPVQVICMPFLGRRTLADALTGYRRNAGPGLSTRKAHGTRRGSSVAGSRSAVGIPSAEPKSSTKCEVLPIDAGLRVGDVATVLPILRQLADGLAHAHERGVLHLDLKPANVLLADTGEPMLLDFNLSYSEMEGKREVVGGTIPYMAPEQLLDLQTRGKGSVDARTDLYSLGVMAFELLTGKHPFPVTSRTLTEFDCLLDARRKGAPSLRDYNPDVSPAVDSIIRKLLAPNPQDRYQAARDLHEDLTRQLENRPLRFAKDRSIPERINKWRRRNPKMLVGLAVAAVLSIAGGAGAYAFNESEKRTASEAESRARALHDGLEAVRLDLVLPGNNETRSRGMKKAMSLLGEFGLPRDPNWQSRTPFKAIRPQQRAALSGDIGELLLLVAQARWEEGKTGDRTAAAKDARILNELARGCFGDAPPPMLVRHRAELDFAIAGRDPVKVEVGEAKTSRDWFLEGVRLFTGLKFDQAIQPLERAIAKEPEHGAAQFLLARCRQHIGEPDAAIERYKSASVLMPHDPRPWYFQGVCLHTLGRHASSEEAFTSALELDSTYGDAYLARGVARMELGEYEEAEADFTQSLALGGPKLQSLQLRAHVREKLNNPGAELDQKAALDLKPERDSDFITLGYTRMKSDPHSALENFRKGLELNPTSLVARCNRIHVLADVLEDKPEAVKASAELVRVFPMYAQGRAIHALCLARLGKRNEALSEVEACRKLLKEKGPNHRDPSVVFGLARVYAVTSESNESDADKAVQTLREALGSGYREFRWIDRNRDLDSIRTRADFERVVKAAKELAN